MRRSRLIGTGSSLPPRIVTNEEVGAVVGLSHEAVVRRTGIRARRWAADGVSSSDLAVEAARAACDAAGLKPSALDAIIVSTTSPDMPLPSTACHVQRILRAGHCAAFDVAASCSGFLYALSMADACIRAGHINRCLVIAAEIKSRSLDRTDESTAILFGDGAGAAVMIAEDSPTGREGVLGVRIGADGSRRDLIGVAAGGSRQSTTVETIRARAHCLRMRGGPLFRVAVRRLARIVCDTLKDCGVAMDEVSTAVFHQANARLLRAVTERLGLSPERVYAVIEQYGNTSSASLPIALDHAVREGRIRRNDLVVLGAFGGGLTWAGGVVRW